MPNKGIVKKIKILNSKTNSDPVNRNYYTSTGKKVLDFIYGFVLNIIIAFVHFCLYSLVLYLLKFLHIPSGIGLFTDNTIKPADSMINSVIGILMIVLIIFVEKFLIQRFFKTRRYIAIGMLWAIIFPLLVTGFCSLIWIGGSFG